MASREFEGKGGGGMWNYKPAKRMLEALWTSGRARASPAGGNFERLYDLPERVLPAEVLDAPMPDEATYLRTLAVRAVRARGVSLRLGDRRALALHRRHEADPPAPRRAGRDAASSSGTRPRTAAHRSTSSPTRSRSRNTAAVLLSPFDNLIWDRAFTERLFGFRHMIEVYKPAHQRQYGYYVLPFLRGERLVGRADLKADRPDGHAARDRLPSGAGRARLGRASHRVRRRSRAPGGPDRRCYDRAHLGLRDARHPRRARAGPDDRRRSGADLPDLHVHPGGGRAAQGLRLRAQRQPDAQGARGVPRVARERRPRLRVQLGDGGDDDGHAAPQPGRPDRGRERRLRRHLPALRQGARAQGLSSSTTSPTEECNTRLADSLDENTKIVWLESPTNPLLNIVDIRAVADAAHAVGALVVVDNTFATPYLQRPLELGADIVVHSTTKYIGGHSDVVGGFAAMNDPSVAERIKFLQNSMGGVPGPFDSWLVLRGLKTLAVRMRQHCENAHRIARVPERARRRSRRSTTRASPTIPATSSRPRRCRTSAG